MLFLGLVGCAIADRWPRRSVLVLTQSVAGILALILWLLTVTDVVQVWQVFTLALLLGVVNAVDMPTRQSFVSELVPSKRLINAVSLNSAQFNVARIAGPGLAGLLIALFDVPFLFLLNAISSRCHRQPNDDALVELVARHGRGARLARLRARAWHPLHVLLARSSPS
jgi:MFS family permease